ncbi:MAG: winged helix-turn-helix domain-containing protein [Candidatus Thorarchaeota archaeon]
MGVGPVAKPIKDLEIVTNKKLIKLLLEPTRAEILRRLGRKALTVKELSVALNKNPGTILHHIQKLKEAKLVREVGTKQTTTGIVQRYYRATAREYRLDASETMRTGRRAAKLAEDRIRSMIGALSAYGVEVPEHKMDEAKEILTQMIERENQILSNLKIEETKGKKKIPDSVMSDASLLMRRFVVDEDPQYRDLRKKWHRFLRSYHIGVMRNE